MIDKTLLGAEGKMEKAVEVVCSGSSGIRLGRANVTMFNTILVDYYDASTPLQQLRTIAISRVRTVLITPSGRSATASIDKALRESDLGVNPTDDGNLIRVILPVLAEERRRDYVKLARNKAEEARVTARGTRHKVKEALDKIKKDGEVGKGDVERAEEKLDRLTKRHVEQVDKVLEGKEKELLEVRDGDGRVTQSDTSAGIPPAQAARAVDV